MGSSIYVQLYIRTAFDIPMTVDGPSVKGQVRPEEGIRAWSRWGGFVADVVVTAASWGGYYATDYTQVLNYITVCFWDQLAVWNSTLGRSKCVSTVWLDCTPSFGVTGQHVTDSGLLCYSSSTVIDPKEYCSRSILVDAIGDGQWAGVAAPAVIAVVVEEQRFHPSGKPDHSAELTDVTLNSSSPLADLASCSQSIGCCQPLPSLIVNLHCN